MKSLVLLPLAALFLVGAGCNQSLDERLTAYEAERKICIQEKRDLFSSSYDGQAAEWDEYEQQKAEYQCSTVDLAKKYYSEDPEGIIELCVRTEQVGNYTYEEGLGGAFTRSEIEQLHESGSFVDITMDERGRVTIGEETLENWRGLCESVIKNVLNPES